MKEVNLKHIFGPVYSWRLGLSLGVDPLSSDEKVCNFNCTYCQIGKTSKFEISRKIFVPTKQIMDEIRSLGEIKTDFYTFSSNGEPTLAKNLGEMINAIKAEKKEKVAVITNASLIDQEDVIEDLLNADVVLVKLDAPSQDVLSSVNQPSENIQFSNIAEGIKAFKNKFKGMLALQIMFVDANKDYAKEISDIAREINPNQVQINTPLRKPCSVKPLAKEELLKITKYFNGLNIINVYDNENKKTTPLNVKDTEKRHGEIS